MGGGAGFYANEVPHEARQETECSLPGLSSRNMVKLLALRGLLKVKPDFTGSK